MVSQQAWQDDEELVSGSRTIRRPLTIAVEGNIGSGKSTFLDHCREKPGIIVYPEPVEQWRNVNGFNLLSKFYVDQRRWALAMQLHVGETMLEIYNRKTWKRIKIVERSLWSSRHCFMESMIRSGTLDGASAFILNKWYDRVLEEPKAKPHGIVYLRTSPIVAYGRMEHRARAEEVVVPMAYLIELHNLHEQWLANIQESNVAGESEIPVFTNEADLPLERLRRRYDECLEGLELLTL